MVAGSITRDGHRWLIRFPFDEALVARVREELPQRAWKRDLRAWEVPSTPAALPPLLTLAESVGFSVPDELRVIVAKIEAERKLRHDLSSALTADVQPDGLTRTLLPYQRAGVAYLTRAKRALLADFAGAGKSAQALATLQACSAWPAVIACPATLRATWRDEIAKWLPDRSSRILLGQPKSLDVARGIIDDQSRVNVYIVGYDCLEAWADVLIEDVMPRGFVADEAHTCAKVKTHRTKAAQRIAKDCHVRLALSASFLLNRPIDLVGPLQIVDRLDDLGGYWTFTNRYCGAWTMELRDGRKVRMTNRATNLPELQSALRSTCFVCRKRSEVLPELPPVRRARVPLELDEDSAAEYRAASRDLTSWLSERLWTNASLDGMTPAAKSAKVAAARLAALSRDERAEGMVKLGALRALAGRGKVDAALAWLDGLLTGDEGILIFAWHRDVLARLGKELGCPVLHGDSAPTERESACFAFQAGTIKVLALQTMLGLGLTLTQAQHVVTVELPWRPADLEQCEGRAYGRINDAHGINSWVLVAEGTVDDKVLSLIETKAEIASDALGGDASSILLGLIATETEG